MDPTVVHLLAYLSATLVLVRWLLNLLNCLIHMLLSPGEVQVG